MKEFSKFKVLGITLLVTMSSCVVGSIDLNAESLKAYGFEFDITSTEKNQSVSKSKKSKLSPNPRFRFTNIIESGREHISFKKLSIDHSPITFQLKYNHIQSPLINRISVVGCFTYAETFQGYSKLNRAGPFC